jgi:hypothetical protein
VAAVAALAAFTALSPLTALAFAVVAWNSPREVGHGALMRR